MSSTRLRWWSAGSAGVSGRRWGSWPWASRWWLRLLAWGFGCDEKLRARGVRGHRRQLRHDAACYRRNRLGGAEPGDGRWSIGGSGEGVHGGGAMTGLLILLGIVALAVALLAHRTPDDAPPWSYTCRSCARVDAEPWGDRTLYGVEGDLDLDHGRPTDPGEELTVIH